MVAKEAAAIGVGELATRASEVISRVRDRGEVVDIADEGTVIARIVPVAKPVDLEALAEWWKRHDELVDEIDRHWPEGVSAADAIADVRRNL
jgi:antitoxin (DNA-binding transcriptional repressor) of toxin-antitoxin stability system